MHNYTYYEHKTKHNTQTKHITTYTHTIISQTRYAQHLLQHPHTYMYIWNTHI